MTKELRTLIELNDVLGVELECQKCKAKIMMPITGAFVDHAPRCFQCGADWFGASYNPSIGAPIALAIKQINELMQKLSQLCSERSDIHVPIRLLIRETSVSDRASSGTD